MTEQIKSRLDEIEEYFALDGAEKHQISLKWLVEQLRTSLEREAIAVAALEELDIPYQAFRPTTMPRLPDVILREALSRIKKLGEPEKESL